MLAHNMLSLPSKFTNVLVLMLQLDLIHLQLSAELAISGGCYLIMAVRRDRGAASQLISRSANQLVS